jgi:hypothetical protein
LKEARILTDGFFYCSKKGENNKEKNFADVRVDD